MKITYFNAPPLPPPRSGECVEIRELKLGEIGYAREATSLEVASIAWEAYEDGIYRIKDKYLRPTGKELPFLEQTWEDLREDRYSCNRMVKIQ
jgi:hypothetical protein